MSTYELEELLEQNDKGLLTPTRLAKFEAMGVDWEKPFKLKGNKKADRIKFEVMQ